MSYATSRQYASNRSEKGFLPTDVSDLLVWWKSDDGGNSRDPANAFSRVMDRQGGFHLNQTTSTRRPASSGTVNGHRTALFNGVATTGHYLQSAAFTLNQPSTTLFLARQVTWVSGRRVFNGLTDGFIHQVGVTPQVLMRTGGTSGPSKTSWTVNTWAFLTSHWSGSSSVFRVNRGRVQGGDPGAAGFGGMTWGASHLGALQGNIEVLEMLGFTRALTALELTRLHAYSAFRLGLSVNNLILEGDSLTAGAGLSLSQTWGEKVVISLGEASWGTNLRASGGERLVENIVPRFSTDLLPYRDNRFARNIVTVWAGTNDIIGGRSAASVYSTLVEYCQRVRENGMEVLVFTTLPRAAFTAYQEAQRLDYNTRIRSGFAEFADGLVDVAVNPLLTNPNDLTYYSDGTHLTDAGTTVAAADVVTAVNAL
jgi:lysophospholipase L1-like esterase